MKKLSQIILFYQECPRCNWSLLLRSVGWAREIGITITTAFLAAIVVLGQQNLVLASLAPLTPAQLAQFARDFAPYPDFFQQGRELFEQEIQRMYQQQNAVHESPLKIELNPQAEIDRLPQIQPSDFSTQSQSE